MRLDDFQPSKNIEDRRGRSSASGRGVRLSGGKLSVGTVVLALAAWYFLGVNPMTLLSGDLSEVMGGSQSSYSQSSSNAQLTDEEGVFVSKVLKTTEDVWTNVFQKNGWGTYPKPKLVLFTGATQSACGLGQSAMGPFYCSADSKVYIDLSFFRDTGKSLGVRGDFAQGYVIAHEVGHHVQNAIGVMDNYHNAVKKLSQKEANALTVRLELQADCFAGIWANALERAGNVIEEGDIVEALKAAEAVGDDTLQRRQQGYVVPDSFTHGSSAQRVEWFNRGFKTGNVNQCNTFAVKE